MLTSFYTNVLKVVYNNFSLDFADVTDYFTKITQEAVATKEKRS